MTKFNALANEVLREEVVSNERDIKLFMGNPERIVYFVDMHEQAIRMLIRETNKGTKFVTAYVKPGQDGYYYSLEPLSDISHQDFKDYQPALVPEEDLTK